MAEDFNADAYAGSQENFARHPSPEFRPDVPISSIDETIAATDLHATSDALNMLSHAAQLDTYATPGQSSHTADRHIISPEAPAGLSSVRADNLNGSLQYALVSQGLLTTPQILQLIARYVWHQSVDYFADDFCEGLGNSTTHIYQLLPGDVSNQILCSI